MQLIQSGGRRLLVVQDGHLEGVVGRESLARLVQRKLDLGLSEGRRIRLLYQFGPDFTGFTAEAAWEDMRVGLQYLRLFERCAIVSDVGWIRESSRLVGAMLPFPVKVFGNDQWPDALAWLSAPVSANALRYRLLPDAGVLVVEPKEPLKAEAFEAVALTVDPWIEAHGTLCGLVVHVREFPGWQNLGSFFRHPRFVRGHHRQVRRVALAADGRVPREAGWAELAPKLAEHFVAAEVKHFGYDQFEEAVAWASAGCGEEARSSQRPISGGEASPP